MTLVDPPPPLMGVVNSRDLVGVLVAMGLTDGVGGAVGVVVVCIDLSVSCVDVMALSSLAAGSIDCRPIIATGLLMMLLLTATVVVK